MLNIINTSNDPYFNLALEEYFVLQVAGSQSSESTFAHQDVCILWQNRPTVVVGRNQNTEFQLNREFIDEQGIDVVRRLSGGGAVYHDAGNLNFTVIKHDAHTLRNDFSFFTEPVLTCLRNFGADVEFAGRNDLHIDGKKFSGNAQYMHHDTLLHHGTILWGSELAVLGRALKAKKRVARGVESVVSRVANVTEYLDTPLSEFREALATELATFGGSDRIDYYLSPDDIETIEELATAKYRTDAWNWGASPQFNWVREDVLSAGNLMVCADVQEGRVTLMRIYGDFFEVQPVSELEALFEGLSVEELAVVALALDAGDYIHRLTSEDFAQLLSV